MIRPRQVRRVAARHVRDALRERRTIVLILLIPVLVVLIFTFQRDQLSSELSSQRAATYTIAAQGTAGAPQFVAFLRAHRIQVVDVPDVESVMRGRKYPAAIEIPARFQQDVDAGRQPSVVVVGGERSLRNQLAQAATVEAIQAFGRVVLEKRLRAAGLPASAAEPVRITPKDVTSARERAGSLLGDLLPVMLLGQVVGLMSGIAIDVTAGEKERRTVEAMLASPLSRREIVMGKWLMTAGIGIIAGSITLIATIVSLRASASSQLGGTFHLPVHGIAVAAIAMVAAVLVLSTVQLSLGFFARSVQQAGVFVTPLVFLAFVPLFLFQSQAGSTIAQGVYALPVLGPALLLRYGISETARAGALPIVVVSSALYAAAGILIADRLFSSERALLRAGG